MKTTPAMMEMRAREPTTLPAITPFLLRVPEGSVWGVVEGGGVDIEDAEDVGLGVCVAERARIVVGGFST